MLEAKRSAPINPLLAEPAQRSTISAAAACNVRDTALGGANTAGSRGGVLWATPAKRSEV